MNDNNHPLTDEAEASELDRICIAITGRAFEIMIESGASQEDCERYLLGAAVTSRVLRNGSGDTISWLSEIVNRARIERDPTGHA